MTKVLIVCFIISSILSSIIANYFQAKKNEKIIEELNKITLENLRCAKTRSANIFYKEAKLRKLDTSRYELCEIIPDFEICPCARLARKDK